MEEVHILLVPAGRDPLDFDETIMGPPEYLEDQNRFTGLSLEEYLDSLSVANGCISVTK
jgi:hypothetical protein